MDTTGVNQGSGADVFWLARSSASLAALFATLVRILVTPQGRHYYVGLVAAWHLPIMRYSVAVVLSCTLGLGCCMCALATIWDGCSSRPVGRRDRVRLLEIAILLLAVVLAATICVPPLLQSLVWIR